MARRIVATLRNLWNAYVGLPMVVQAAKTVDVIFFGLVGLALAVALSPLLAVLVLLACLVCLAVFCVRLLRRRPVMRWGLAGGASFVLLLAFSGVSAALYEGTAGRIP